MEMPMDFEHVILNGRIKPAGEAKVSLFSPALFNSFGVYESVEVIEKVPFHLREHLSRLAESAEMIELNLPHSTLDIATWISHLLQENGPQDCLLRIIALGVTQIEDEGLVAVLPQPLPRYPDSYYWEGASVITFEGCRPLPACKSLNTLVNYLARRQAVRSGAHEAILRTSGEMTEGSRSNIFAVRRGEILTPPSERTLSGITRDITIRLALEAGYRVSEVPLNLMDLSHFGEFFVTSTSMHIIPIVRIGDALVGEGQVGPVTTDLMDRFEQYHRDYLQSKR
jgi:branched-subunit amino acid aminotransferase/4-amino-4-deoxychorismate lyase